MVTWGGQTARRVVTDLLASQSLAEREAADRARFERTLVDRLETFDEAETLRAFRHVVTNAPDAARDALDAIDRGDA